MTNLSEKINTRVTWLDVARGGTILLVVSWHAYYAASFLGDINGVIEIFNKAANPIRMPLFFFCSGMLASGVILKNWGGVVEKRLITAAWVVFIWSSIHALINFCINLYPWGFWDRSPDFFFLFWVPMGVLWFIYASTLLVVFAKFVQPLPLYLQVLASTAFLFLSAQIGRHSPEEWESVSLLFRELERYAIFAFMAGIWLQVAVKRYFDSIKNARIAFLVAILPALALMAAKAKGYQFFENEVPKIFIAVFVIPVAISISRMTSEIHRVRKFLVWFGNRTLEIFVGHMIFVALVFHYFDENQLQRPNLAFCLMLSFGVLGPLAIRWISDKLRLNWLYEYPKKIRAIV